jgi:hypothetical protein
MSAEPDTPFPPAGGNRNWGWLVLVLGAGAVLLILHRFNPVEYGFYPRCELHRLTGLHCPGCGSQRALHALTHGDFAAALRANALLILGAPAALLLWLTRRSSGPVTRQGSPPPLPGVAEKFWVKWIVIVVVVFTLARNLPFAPFHWLAP